MKTLEHKQFELENGVLINGDYAFKTKEDANTYASLKCKWWGSNLVYLGAEEKDGYFFPYFNVWD